MARAWLGRTAAREIDLAWYVSGATEFVDLALARSQGPPGNGRERKFLDLPAIGLGKGGGSHKTGAVLYAMVSTIAQKAASCSAEIALVRAALPAAGFLAVDEGSHLAQYEQPEVVNPVPIAFPKENN